MFARWRCNAVLEVGPWLSLSSVEVGPLAQQPQLQDPKNLTPWLSSLSSRI